MSVCVCDALSQPPLYIVYTAFPYSESAVRESLTYRNFNFNMNIFAVKQNVNLANTYNIYTLVYIYKANIHILHIYIHKCIYNT